MGLARWMNSSRRLVTDAATQITASSIFSGALGTARKEGTGSASMDVGGAFTGSGVLEYLVRIDSVAGGAEVGQATFRWKTSDDSTWVATGVTTSSTFVTLNNGVQVKWTSGTGDDFALNDEWTFKAVRQFGVSKILDPDPDTKWRSDLFTNRVTTSNANIEEEDAGGGPAYNDHTAAAVSTSGSTFSFFDVAADRLYVGLTAPFSRITVDLTVAGAGKGSLTVEYYNGSIWTAVSGLSDGTEVGGNTMAQDGIISFTRPVDWAKQGLAALDSDKYYVRLKPASTGTTDPTAEHLVPDSVPESLTIDLSTAQAVTAVVIHNSNHTSGAEVAKLMANSSDEWGTPAFEQDLTFYSPTIVVYPVGQTYRYWRIEIGDSNISNGFLEIGMVHIGTYLELDSSVYYRGLRRRNRQIEEVSRTESGIQRAVLANRDRAFRFPLHLTDADYDSLVSLYEDVYDLVNLIRRPFFFNFDSGEPEQTILAAFSDNGIESNNELGIGSNAFHEVNLILEEVVRSPV